MKITNRDQIINELAEMLINFDKDANSYYPTDVYMYIKDDNTAYLDTFANPGGNSWCADDHITIYTDKEHYDDGVKNFCTESAQFAEVLEISFEQLAAETRNYHRYDDDEDLEYRDFYDYIFDENGNKNYYSKICKAYNDCIDDQRSDYYEAAKSIINDVVDDDGNIID